MSGRSVLDEAIAGSGRAGALHHELEALQHAMGDPAQADDMDRILARFGEVQEEYEHLGGYALESQAREVLHGLGFEDEQIDGDVGALSGGWKMRVAMARVLLGRPDVLLMDEPTNHLDIESIIWLEAFLKSLPGALLMTSHDRDFMNRIVVAHRGDRRRRDHDATPATTISTSASGRSARPTARRRTRGSRRCSPRSSASSIASRRTRRRRRRCRAASRRSRRSRRIELPKKRRVVEVRLPPAAALRAIRWRSSRASRKAYGRRVVHDGLDLTIRRGERWCVMGRNGAGKTTLLKMVAGALAPDAGEVRLGASLKLGYFAQQALDLLDPDLTVWEQMRAGLPARIDRRAAQPRSARSSSPATRSTRRSARCRAARRRGWCWRACCSIRRTSSCSTSRPTISISRRRTC